MSDDFGDLKTIVLANGLVAIELPVDANTAVRAVLTLAQARQFHRDFAECLMVAEKITALPGGLAIAHEGTA